MTPKRCTTCARTKSARSAPSSGPRGPADPRETARRALRDGRRRTRARGRRSARHGGVRPATDGVPAAGGTAFPNRGARRPARRRRVPRTRLRRRRRLVTGLPEAGSGSPRCPAQPDFAQRRGLGPTELDCPGEATTSMVSRSICRGAASQGSATERFLAANRGRARLVTLVIGANDVEDCTTAAGIDLARANDRSPSGLASWTSAIRRQRVLYQQGQIRQARFRSRRRRRPE